MKQRFKLLLKVNLLFQTGMLYYMADGQPAKPGRFEKRGIRSGKPSAEKQVVVKEDWQLRTDAHGTNKKKYWVNGIFQNGKEAGPPDGKVRGCYPLGKACKSRGGKPADGSIYRGMD